MPPTAHSPSELILNGHHVGHGTRQSPRARLGDGEQGERLEMALEHWFPGKGPGGPPGTSSSSITPLAAPHPLTCSFQGKACLVRLSLGCVVARSDRWPLENQPSESCPSLCHGSGRERWEMGDQGQASCACRRSPQI